MALANVLVSLSTIIILMACTPCVHCHNVIRNTTCSQSCSILFSPIDSVNEIESKIREKSNHVVYLTLRDKNDNPLFTDKTNTLFTWIRLDFGQSLAIMPIDLYVLSSFLPLFFTKNVNLTVYQHPDNCFYQLDEAEQDDCIFEGLNQVAGVNHDCYGDDCGTICKRYINTLTPLDNVTFSCYGIHDHTEVCDACSSTEGAFEAFRYISFLLSVFLAAGWLKWFLQEIPLVQR